MNSISLSRSSHSALNDFKSLRLTSPNNGNRIYYKNLNGLRFFAALLVILSHLEALKHILGLRNYEHVRFFANAGCLGVVLFFVLSGFLITSLLVREQSEFKHININKFYIRRALRIWPLYFLILFLASFIFPSIPFLSYTSPAVASNRQFVLYLLLMPNISGLFFVPLPFLAQLWSIGVEEQFYMIWPVILSKTKNLFRFICKFVLIIWAMKLVLSILLVYYPIHWIGLIVQFIHTTPFDSLLTGALGAVVLEYKQFEKFKRVIFHQRFQVIFYLLLSWLVVTGFYFPYINTQAYSFLFLLLIMNLALNERCIISLENKVLNYLGKISYGLYIYHIVGIILTIKIAKLYSIDSYLALMLASVSITIFLSIISFEFFEKWFLRVKEKYAFDYTRKAKLKGLYLANAK